MDQSPDARRILSSQQLKYHKRKKPFSICQVCLYHLDLSRIYVRKSCNQYLHFMFTVDGVSGSNTISSVLVPCGSFAHAFITFSMRNAKMTQKWPLPYFRTIGHHQFELTNSRSKTASLPRWIATSILRTNQTSNSTSITVSITRSNFSSIF